MKKLIILFFFLSPVIKTNSQYKNFDQYPVYNGTDLGLVYTPARSVFRIWSPQAEAAEIIFYKDGYKGAIVKSNPMQKGKDGTWYIQFASDLYGDWYAFKVLVNGKWSGEVPDPYAKVVGVNGKRAMVALPARANPVGWNTDKSPVFKNKTDAILYELHVRDASISANSGIKHKGKFLGLTETGTVNKEGWATGLDHFKEMGVTHIHLLPSYDLNSIDESAPDKVQYNWGYDPLNYNAVEGSYATNALDGLTRIREFKQLIKTLHDNGLRVVMDVVYNHTALTGNSNFNQLVPGYYYRQTPDGRFSNATACGNETASERPMMRKFILESMKYWVQEYHIDGFRIDLMGVHDIETMNIISKELHKIRPDILLYGEGWTAGHSPLPDSLRALKGNAYLLDRIAVFSDDIRDGIKGSVFNHKEKGFASGQPGMEETIKFGVVASLQHPQVDYSRVKYSKTPFALQPWHTVTYAECHDNHVLWDKLAISASEVADEERKDMHKLALAIVLTSQGIAFLHAGCEFLRSKKGVENSFESPDSINQIDWSLKTKNKDILGYVKAMIRMRKEHPAFRMAKAGDIVENIRFMENLSPGLVAYTINGAAVKDKWKQVFVVYNGNGSASPINLPGGKWKLFTHNSRVLDKEGQMVVPAWSCSIFYR